MYSNYTFRFQSILSLKDKIEVNKRNDFGIAVKKLEFEKECLNNLENKRLDIIEELKSKTQNAIKVQDYRNISNNIQYLDRSIDRQSRVIKRQEKNVENCKDALINAKKETKIFEKIKENDYMKYKYKETKLEEMQVDHFVSYKSSRK